MFARQGRRSVRDLGIRISVITRIFCAAMMLVPGAGHRARVRRRRLPRDPAAHLTVGTLIALATLLLRLLGPLQGLSNVRIDVMTALVSFDRVFEVLDLPSMIQEKPDAVALPHDRRRGSSSTHVAFRYPRADEISLASLETVARTESRDTGEVLHDITFTAEPGQMVALVGPSGAGKTTITHLVARLYDVTVGRGPRRRARRARRDAAVARGRRRLRDPGRPHVPRHDPREPALRPPRAPTDEQIWAALEAAQIATLVRALPDGLDTVVGDRGYRLSGGERQRLAIARLLLKAPADRGARRGDRPPRLRVRGRRPAGPRRGARGPHLAWSSPTGSPPSATPT